MIPVAIHNDCLVLVVFLHLQTQIVVETTIPFVALFVTQLDRQHKDQDVEECRRKLRELETPRGQKVEYVGILIFWLKKHIQHLESRG